MDAGMICYGRIFTLGDRRESVYIEVLERIQIPIDEVTGITYQEEYYLGGTSTDTFTFSFRERKLTFERKGSDEREFKAELKYDHAAWRNVMRKFRKCNFLVWDDAYSQAGCAGMAWELTIRRGRKKPLIKRGDSAFPEEWDIFGELLSEVLHLRRTTARGTFGFTDGK